MIDEIHVRNLALIDEATIVPAEGLTVLTGETGAGKTALLMACKLLMGARADRTAVREGEAESCVEGRFFFGDDEHVVCRRVSADGRSRVQHDGRMASVGDLAEVIAPTIDLCSQHDSQELLRPASHLRMLDAWAQTTSLTHAYQQAYERAQAAAARLDEVRMGARASADQLDQASFMLRQIEAVSPDVQEYDELTAALKKAEHVEALARAACSARDAVSGDGGALDQAGAALTALEEGARVDESLDTIADALREAVFLLEDAARDIAAYAGGIEFEPDELAQMQERVASYQGLLRAYGPTVADVLAKAAEARARIQMVDESERLEAEAQAQVELAEAELAECAQALSVARAEAASEFAERISAVMARLEMGSAEVSCTVEPQPRAQWGPSGGDRIELAFRPAQNMQARPLSRIASGGELSRVLLALHVVMEDKDEVSTLVFDEIDAGVGGATAVALAEVLAELAQTHQVLVVTHLAQVAARATKHYVVRKTEKQGVARTQLIEVRDQAREDEIARMLSGGGTQASLAHARELLERSAQ